MNRDLLGKGWNMLPNIFQLWIIKAGYILFIGWVKVARDFPGIYIQ
jgi:hypothetical protein